MPLQRDEGCPLRGVPLYLYFVKVKTSFVWNHIVGGDAYDWFIGGIGSCVES